MLHKIQIEVIISAKRSKAFWWLKKNLIIQTKPFVLGFRFTNIGDEPTGGFTITNIVLTSAEGKNITHNVDKSFHIDALNPGASTLLWIDKMGTFMHGLADVELNLRSDSTSDTIETYQKDQFTKTIGKYRHPNKWLDFIYVRSYTEDIQNTNSLLLLFLTYLMTIVVVINFIFFLKYQVMPQINIENKNKFDAKIFCNDHPDSEWPSAAGGSIKCSEVMQSLKK